MALILILVSTIILIAIVAYGVRFKKTKSYWWRRDVLLIGAIIVSMWLGTLNIGSLDTEDVAGNTDYLVLVDTTLSMNALDGRNNERRIETAKKDLESINRELNGSQFGMITFNAQVNNYLPMTSNQNDSLVAIDTLKTVSSFSAYSDIVFTDALNFAGEYFRESNEIDSTREKILVILTDGELNGNNDSRDSVLEAARAIAGDIDSAMVIGYGSPNGSNIPVTQLNRETGEIEVFRSTFDDSDEIIYTYASIDGRQQLVVSSRNDELLSEMATTLGGRYVTHEGEAEITETIKKVRREGATSTRQQDANASIRQNPLHIPLAITILILFMALEIAQNPKARKFVLDHPKPGSFRRKK